MTSPSCRSLGTCQPLTRFSGSQRPVLKSRAPAPSYPQMPRPPDCPSPLWTLKASLPCCCQTQRRADRCRWEQLGVLWPGPRARGRDAVGTDTVVRRVPCPDRLCRQARGTRQSTSGVEGAAAEHGARGRVQPGPHHLPDHGPRDRDKGPSLPPCALTGSHTVLITRFSGSLTQEVLSCPSRGLGPWVGKPLGWQEPETSAPLPQLPGSSHGSPAYPGWARERITWGLIR